jgi:hypothetical protein
MKRLIALCLLSVLLLLGFYVAWPGWTGYRIASALKSGDSATLDRKIVFADVRLSLRPATERKIAEVYDAYQAQAGSAGPIIGQIKRDVVPKIVDLALETLVTPENLIRLARAKTALKDGAERILKERVARIGLPGLQSTGPSQGSDGGEVRGGIKLKGPLAGLADKVPGLGGIVRRHDEPAQSRPGAIDESAEGADKPTYGLANIKHVGVLGPLAFELGVSKDAAATEADVMVELRFVNGDWRVTAVRPRG